MEKTKEIRWFMPAGTITPPEWFDKLDFNTRFNGVEYYLSLQPEGLEAKVVDQNLRLKQRVEQASLDGLTEKAWGYGLNFISWKFALADHESLSRVTGNSDHYWWPVHKKRRTAQFGEVNGSFAIRPASEKLDCGCRVSFSEIEVCGSMWDTLSFEFYGSNCLKPAPDLLHEILGDRELHQKDSMGYAQFLDKLVDKYRTSLYSDSQVLPANEVVGEIGT